MTSPRELAPSSSPPLSPCPAASPWLKGPLHTNVDPGPHSIHCPPAATQGLRDVQMDAMSTVMSTDTDMKSRQPQEASGRNLGFFHLIGSEGAVWVQVGTSTRLGVLVPLGEMLLEKG